MNFPDINIDAFPLLLCPLFAHSGPWLYCEAARVTSIGTIMGNLTNMMRINTPNGYMSINCAPKA